MCTCIVLALHSHSSDAQMRRSVTEQSETELNTTQTRVQMLQKKQSVYSPMPLKSFKPRMPLLYNPAPVPDDYWKSVSAKMLEAMYGVELAHDLALFSLKQAGETCEAGKKLQILVLPGEHEQIGAFCAPECPEGYVLNVSPSEEGGVEYACLKVSAPSTPPPTRAPPPVKSPRPRRPKKAKTTQR